VREGRRREFARFPEFRDPATRDRIPDPNSPATFERSRLDWHELERDRAHRRLERVRSLLATRAREIVPRVGDCTGEAARYEVRDRCAVRVTWRLDDGAELSVLANLSERPIGGLDWLVRGRVIWQEPAGLALDRTVGDLPAWSVAWILAPPGGTP
jgi:1,4-alpha-glucan branching enzyme